MMKIDSPLKLGLAAVAALAITACGGKESVRQPAELVDITNSAVKPHKVWSARAGDGSEGRVSGLRLRAEYDALYVADRDGRIYVYGLDDGALLWKKDTEARVYSGPTIAGATMYVGTLDAEVIALKRADGSELWRRKMSSEVLGPPATEGDVVVARTVDGRVYGLSASDGERVWSFDRLVPSLVLRGSSAPLVMGGRAFVGMDNGRIVSLNVRDGQPLWEQVVAAPSGRNELERLVDIDADLLPIGSCIMAASFGGEVSCLEPESGQILWRRAIRSYNSMSASEDKLFLTDDTGVLWALDQGSGAAAWKQEDLLYRRLSAPAYYKGFVVVGDFEGYLHWIDANSGELVARSRVGSDPIIAQPVAGVDKLFVMGSTGRISAIDVPSGALASAR